MRYANPYAVMLLAVCIASGALHAQQAAVPYTIPVRSDEVDLIFGVTDSSGRALENVQLADLMLMDNGRVPLRVLDFEKRSNLPIRAGILVDTSESMSDTWRRDRQIASELVAHVLRMDTDKAFVMQFDFEPSMKQGWTNNVDALRAGTDNVAHDTGSRMGGTAIFDSIYIACRDQFSRNLSSSGGTGNFILLLSDGVDNFSHARLEDALNKCQQTHTSIYVFSDAAKPSHNAGQKVLQDLAAKSGGRIFYHHGDQELLDDLHQIEGDLRNNYLIVYKPAKLKPDGSFHRIQMYCKKPDVSINVKTGYYADR
jgi:VWFA-related protein